MIVVRNAEPHEYDAVAQIILKSYEEYGPQLPEDGWQQYARNILDVRSRMVESELLVAVQDETFVGSVTFYPTYMARVNSGWPQDWTGIRLVAVIPEYRGRGVGKAIMDECIRRSRDQGAQAVALHTTPYMTLAQGMYEHMGFVRIPGYDFHPRPDLTVMAYKLRLFLPPLP
jgi:predicted N-acetyltransferase YhbS